MSLSNTYIRLCHFFFLMIRRPPRSTLFSLHDALPISTRVRAQRCRKLSSPKPATVSCSRDHPARSEEHTSELQSRLHLVCRLLLEKKNSTRLIRRMVNQTCGTSVITLPPRPLILYPPP